MNPLRYRGYYYDSETGFYYLQSRYYDPVTKRFLNADDVSVLSATPKELFNKNLFSYCDNNPVIRADCQGDFWGIVILAVAVGGLISGGLEIAKQKSEGKSWGEIDYIDVAIETMNGMISGALFAVAASIPAVTNEIFVAGKAFVNSVAAAAHTAHHGGNAFEQSRSAVTSIALTYLLSYGKNIMQPIKGFFDNHYSTNNTISKLIQIGIDKIPEPTTPNPTGRDVVSGLLSQRLLRGLFRIKQ